MPWAVLAGEPAAAGFTAAPVGAGVEVRWKLAGDEHRQRYPPAPVPPAPPRPDAWADNPPDLPVALAEAGRTAGPSSARFAFDRVRLRGGTGEVAGTDGRVLLTWGGFSFPWDGDVLVPAAAARAAGGAGKAARGRCRVGRTDAHVVVAAGRLTVWLGTGPGGRFPPTGGVAPPAASARTRLTLGPRVTAALAELPGGRCTDVVTLAMIDDRVVATAGPTAVELPGVTAVGPRMRVAVNRGHLARAVRLGFREVVLAGPGRPAVCRDARRAFLFVTREPAADDMPPAPPTGGGRELADREAAPSRQWWRRGPAAVVPRLLGLTGWLGRVTRGR